MTTAVWTRASVLADEVREESRSLEPGKVLLTLLFVVPFLVGWLVGACWSVLAWTWAAVVVGFRVASSDRKGTPA